MDLVQQEPAVELPDWLALLALKQVDLVIPVEALVVLTQVVVAVVMAKVNINHGLALVAPGDLA